MIHVVVADDHRLVREGLIALLNQTPDIKVVGEATTGLEAVDLVENQCPEVVVMDLSMRRLNGAQAAERLKGMGKAPAVIVLSVYSDPVLIQNLLRRGIKGYLLKDSSIDELLLAIRAASQGELYLSPAIAASVMNLALNPNNGTEPERLADLLTSREREVLQLVSEGLTNFAVAETLNISVKTVEKHRANLMEKLDVQDLASLIKVAIQQNLKFPDLGQAG